MAEESSQQDVEVAVQSLESLDIDQDSSNVDQTFAEVPYHISNPKVILGVLYQKAQARKRDFKDDLMQLLVLLAMRGTNPRNIMKKSKPECVAKFSELKKAYKIVGGPSAKSDTAITMARIGAACPGLLCKIYYHGLPDTFVEPPEDLPDHFPPVLRSQTIFAVIPQDPKWDMVFYAALYHAVLFYDVINRNHSPLGIVASSVEGYASARRRSDYVEKKDREDLMEQFKLTESQIAPAVLEAINKAGKAMKKILATETPKKDGCMDNYFAFRENMRSALEETQEIE